GLHLEFLDGVDRRIDDAAVDVRSGVGCAVEQQLLRSGSSAPNVEVGFEEVASEFLTAAVAEIGAERHAGGKADQRQRVAHIERKIFDCPGNHHLADRRGGRLEYF